MFRVLLCSAMLAAAFLITGCAGSTLSDAEKEAAVAAATLTREAQPGDKNGIVVFGEDNLYW